MSAKMKPGASLINSLNIPEELIAMIRELDLIPAERVSFYNILEIW